MRTSHRTASSGLSVATLGRDVAMLAHDMRGELQGVIGGVSLLSGADLSPANRLQIDRVSAAAGNLARLLATFLGDEDDRRTDCVELSGFVGQLAKRWAGEAEERGIRLDVDVAAGAPAAIRCNRTLLSRALDNLIGNSMRYAGPGTVLLRVRRTEDGGAALQVLDEGPGISEAAIEKVLGRAARPDAARDDLHGLGLHIVRSFCAEMGIGLALGRRPTGGTEATLAFPAAAVEPAFAIPAAVPDARADLAGVRVLLAEDNATNQIVAMEMLRALKAEVTLSSDGVEAMEKFELGRFDLVIVDIEMPRMTGLDVIRAIRGRRDGRDRIPIVALTAYAMREHRERIAAAGANDLISKPITNIEAFGRTLRSHVAPGGPTGLPPAEGPVPRSGEPVADLEIFDALCAAIGADMMAELLEKVVADLSQARGELLGALSPLDPKPIRSASHILISVAGAIGAARLHSCARTLNAVATVEDGRDLADITRRCIEEIDAAVAFADTRRAEA